MALRILKSTDIIEVRTLVACLYSPPGVGKTSTAFTADKPLLLDFDKGSHRSGNRGDIVPVETWDDVTNITADDLKAYKTLVVDTAGRALDVLAADIIKSNPKMARGGALSLQGFGELKAKFVAWTKLIRSFGLDIVLLAHSDEQKNGDEVIERLDMQGGSKNEIYKAADLMGRLYVHGGKRWLNFSPTDCSFGKNPAQLPAFEIPDFAAEPLFLAGVIARTKESLNKLTAAQASAAAAQAEWAERIGKAQWAADFNGLLEPAKNADDAVRENVKRLLVKIAKEKGVTFNKGAGKFEGPEAPANETRPDEEPKVAEPAPEAPAAEAQPQQPGLELTPQDGGKRTRKERAA